MFEDLLQRHQVSQEKLIAGLSSKADWSVTPIFVRRSAKDEPRIAMLHTPSWWLYDHVIGLNVNPLSHVLDHDAPEDQGMWVNLHIDDTDVGHRVYVTPSGLNAWEVHHGSGGILRGGLLTHL